MRLAMDSTVYVAFPPRHLHLFDRRSGRRLAAGAPSMEGVMPAEAISRRLLAVNRDVVSSEE
jgi:hypothetical protein